MWVRLPSSSSGTSRTIEVLIFSFLPLSLSYVGGQKRRNMLQTLRYAQAPSSVHSNSEARAAQVRVRRGRWTRTNQSKRTQTLADPYQPLPSMIYLFRCKGWGNYSPDCLKDQKSPLLLAIHMWLGQIMRSTRRSRRSKVPQWPVWRESIQP